MKYSKDHEWVNLQDGIGVIGITNYAQKQLGDIVFIELPKVGDTVIAGKNVAVVESVKAASEVYSPVSGKIVEINQGIITHPDLVNSDPQKSAWFFKIELSDLNELNKLMTEEEYKKTFDL